MGAVVGIVCGLMAALPIVVLLGRREPKLGHGAGAAAFAFLLIQGALLVAWRLCPQEVLPLGVLSVTVFLLVVTAAVIRRELHR